MAQKGTLWLGNILGADYIGHEIKKDLVLITGVTAAGDCAVGTGLLVIPGVVLTCAHVIDDMKIDDRVEWSETGRNLKKQHLLAAHI